MITIETRIIPPTSHRPRRVVASNGDFRHVYSLYESPDCTDLTGTWHRHAVTEFCKARGWTPRTLQGGHTKAGMVWTLIDPDNQIAV